MAVPRGHPTGGTSVSLDHLWAGWRAAYVDSVGSTGAERPTNGRETPLPLPSALTAITSSLGESDCVFCAILAADLTDEERFVVWRGEGVLAILNAYPYASGHLMVMPTRHLRHLEELTVEESASLWDATLQAVSAVRSAYHPEGLNVGLNLGRAAGAGIPGHLHVHVVPRWVGDTNFMTAAASVRVLPEALPDSFERLRSAWR
jgi:ATP adenylyltransferase